MLRIKLEVVPYGNESKCKVIDTMIIINTADHPNRPKYGNYIAEIDDNGGRRLASVKDHRRDDGVWELVRLALNADW